MSGNLNFQKQMSLLTQHYKCLWLFGIESELKKKERCRYDYISSKVQSKGEQT